MFLFKIIIKFRGVVGWIFKNREFVAEFVAKELYLGFFPAPVDTLKNNEHPRHIFNLPAIEPKGYINIKVVPICLANFWFAYSAFSLGVKSVKIPKIFYIFTTLAVVNLSPFFLKERGYRI